MALRPLRAFRVLLSGVAMGFVEGVTAPTTPTGRAISTSPCSGSSLMIPQEGACFKSRKSPSVFR